eukprot:6462489-Amphidinium_carterae.3
MWHDAGVLALAAAFAYVWHLAYISSDTLALSLTRGQLYCTLAIAHLNNKWCMHALDVLRQNHHKRIGGKLHGYCGGYSPSAISSPDDLAQSVRENTSTLLEVQETLSDPKGVFRMRGTETEQDDQMDIGHGGDFVHGRCTYKD